MKPNPTGAVRVTFDNKRARFEFERAWRARVPGAPIDKIVNGVEYMGANAERAADIAGEVVGVNIQEIDV